LNFYFTMWLWTTMAPVSAAAVVPQPEPVRKRVTTESVICRNRPDFSLPTSATISPWLAVK
jgi:hypothetical protein